MANQKPRRRKINQRAQFVVALIVIVIALIAAASFFSKPQSKLNMKQLPIISGDATAFSTRGLVYIRDNKLYYDDLARGKQNFETTLYGTGFEIEAGPEFFVVYNEKFVQVFSYEGIALTKNLVFKSKVVSIRCGENYFAILRQNEAGEFAISVISSTGVHLAPISFANSYVLDFGLYSGDKLWVIMLNETVEDLATNIITYEYDKSGNEKKLTVSLTIVDEIIAEFYTYQDSFYVFGTNLMRRYSPYGKEEQSKVIYGWSVLDEHYDGTNSYFLMRSHISQNNLEHSGQGRILKMPGENQPTNIRYPSGCVAAFFQNGKIIMLTKDMAYISDLNGQLLESIALDVPIDSAKKISAGRVLLTSGENKYIATFGL